MGYQSNSSRFLYSSVSEGLGTELGAEVKIAINEDL